MNSFFKSFFGALLALVCFSLLIVFILALLVGSIGSSGRPALGVKAVLVLDLGEVFHERMQENPLGSLGAEDQYVQPAGYDLFRLLHFSTAGKTVTGNFRIKEYPDPKYFFDLLFNSYRKSLRNGAVKEELG